jgi:hypothetical protein
VHDAMHAKAVVFTKNAAFCVLDWEVHKVPIRNTVSPHSLHGDNALCLRCFESPVH